MLSASNIAQNYYIQMGKKNTQGIAQYLHSNVRFVSPMAILEGKNNVLSAAEKFMNIFESIEIRQKFENKNSAMIILDFICPSPIIKFSAATFITINDGLIYKMELFFDTKPFS